MRAGAELLDVRLVLRLRPRDKLPRGLRTLELEADVPLLDGGEARLRTTESEAHLREPLPRPRALGELLPMFLALTEFNASAALSKFLRGREVNRLPMLSPFDSTSSRFLREINLLPLPKIMLSLPPFFYTTKKHWLLSNTSFVKILNFSF